jgi:hypothetical protein
LTVCIRGVIRRTKLGFADSADRFIGARCEVIETS